MFYMTLWNNSGKCRWDPRPLPSPSRKYCSFPVRTVVASPLLLGWFPSYAVKTCRTIACTFAVTCSFLYCRRKTKTNSFGSTCAHFDWYQIQPCDDLLLLSSPSLDKSQVLEKHMSCREMTFEHYVCNIICGMKGKNAMQSCIKRDAWSTCFVCVHFVQPLQIRAPLEPPCQVWTHPKTKRDDTKRIWNVFSFREISTDCTTMQHRLLFH